MSDTSTVGEQLPQRFGLVRRYARRNPDQLSDEDLLAIELPVHSWQMITELLRSQLPVSEAGAEADAIQDELERHGWPS